MTIPDRDDVEWRVDLDFLESNWTCIWDSGCLGIEDVAAPERSLGCCSVGVELLDEEEAMRITALAATLEPRVFQHHDEALDAGVLRHDALHTRVVDGACIFLNRPGFVGGAGCALHGQATRDDESPLDWKPAVCWQLPLRVDRSVEDGTPVATLRRWSRPDWGPDGETMAWCCTEGERAYVGSERVIDSLGEELQALMGDEVLAEIRRRLTAQDG